MLTHELTAQARAAFTTEADLMARLSTHPYIVTIYQAGVARDGRPYLVMEYCSRPSLSERYKRQPLSVVDALRTGDPAVGRGRDRARGRHPAPRHQARPTC